MCESLIISLIGMFGSGKTYWSEKLEAEGFQRFGCDDFIESRLDSELKQMGYTRGIKEVARWMGQPFDPQYPKTSKRYLDLEEDSVVQALAMVERSRPGSRIVIDTTGSVIYLPDSLLARLADMTRVVYLNTPEYVKEEKYQQYLLDPKPVIWGNLFSPTEGESNMDVLARCYPHLLAFRSAKYAKIADVTLDFHQLRKPDFTTGQFIQAISK